MSCREKEREKNSLAKVNCYHTWSCVLHMFPGSQRKAVVRGCCWDVGEAADRSCAMRHSCPVLRGSAARLPPGDSRSLQFKDKERRVSWFEVSATQATFVGKIPLILDLNLLSSLYRNTASLWQSWQHKTDFIQFQLNTVPSGSLRIWSLACG